MRLRRFASGIAVALMLAGCTGATPAGSTPPVGASTPGASATPAPVATPIAVSPPAATPVPPQPIPSFEGDPQLAASFPTQVAGQPVSAAMTGRFIDFLTALGSSQAETDLIRQQFASIGIDLDSVILGSANANVNGSTVGILAFRFPGQDANRVIETYASFSSLNEGDVLSKETSGGKNVTVIRSSGGFASTWMYATGDILWTVNTSNQEQAAAIFSALP